MLTATLWEPEEEKILLSCRISIMFLPENQKGRSLKKKGARRLLLKERDQILLLEGNLLVC
ncbi:hypothetical protein BOX24_03335 [Leptospirillum ferriphilum]|uniref:Uncharacterized protein n=1 Tax=Leptospirillum ferriphilum TaxID=178606 RepID=A0A1V3SWL3_9BACT|nr:hypothetical protein BOX24_03335 [Leptospirillum ferriphilum]